MGPINFRSILLNFFVKVGNRLLEKNSWHCIGEVVRIFDMKFKKGLIILYFYFLDAWFFKDQNRCVLIFSRLLYKQYSRCIIKNLQFFDMLWLNTFFKFFNLYLFLRIKLHGQLTVTSYFEDFDLSKFPPAWKM